MAMSMASSRRFLNSIARQTRIIFFSSSTSHSLLTSLSLQRLPLFLSPHFQPSISRHFSYDSKNPSTRPATVHDQDHNEVDDEDDDDDDEEVDYSSEDDDDDDDEKQVSNEPSNLADRSYFVEEKILEAARIGYKVIGPLQPGDRVFKSYESAFAVVQVGSHQFKVSNGDCVYVEKLKYCEVNDKLILNKVLMAGSQSQTMIGRPILPNIAVHAVVEEHALDAKVIIFKKKRRKNYRRTKGHRQELTRLRITDIQGIEKPEMTPVGKTPMTSVKKVEKVAMAV